MVVEHVGQQIQELRVVRGLGQAELAEGLGVDVSAICNIEKGRRSVKTEELVLLARQLGVSPMAILEPESFVGKLSVAARHAGSATVPKVSRKLFEFADLHQLLAEDGISAPTVSDLLFSPPQKITYESVAELAEKVSQALGEWDGRNRFERLAQAVEASLGVDVAVEDLGKGELPGAAITEREFPLILVNSAYPLTHSLFTLAHEIGHIVLSPSGGFVVDPDHKSRGSDAERFANYFAASLLMPADRMRTMIDKDSVALSLVEIASTFEVSYLSLVYRLHNLGMINAQGRDQLLEIGWHGILDEAKRFDGSLPESVRGWATEVALRHRPGDRPPRHLSTRAVEAFKRGYISAAVLSQLTFVSEDELWAEYFEEVSLAKDADEMSLSKDVIQYPDLPFFPDEEFEDTAQSPV